MTTRAFGTVMTLLLTTAIASAQAPQTRGVDARDPVGTASGWALAQFGTTTPVNAELPAHGPAARAAATLLPLWKKTREAPRDSEEWRKRLTEARPAR